MFCDTTRCVRTLSEDAAEDGLPTTPTWKIWGQRRLFHSISSTSEYRVNPESLQFAGTRPKIKRGSVPNQAVQIRTTASTLPPMPPALGATWAYFSQRCGLWGKGRPLDLSMMIVGVWCSRRHPKVVTGIDSMALPTGYILPVRAGLQPRWLSGWFGTRIFCCIC